MIQDKIPLLMKLLDVVPKILRILDILTIGRILLISFFIALSIACFSMWEERELIVNEVAQVFLPSDKKWNISEATEKTIKDEINNHPYAMWAIITEMDLGSNSKKNKFWYNEDILVNNTRKSEILDNTANQIFNFNKQHTDQMIKILRNEIVCEPLLSTPMAKTTFVLSSQTENICTIAIPPFYGRFVGVLTIGVRGPLTDDVIFSIKSLASNISASVYWRDVIKLP